MLRNFIFAFVVCIWSSFALAASPLEATCATVKTNDELSTALDARKGDKATLVYARADWAISSVTTLDTFIPSISFIRAVGDLNCIIVDITADGGMPVLKRFDVKGVPFLALLDSENQIMTKRLGGVSYEAFQDWLRNSKQFNAKP